MSKHVLRNSGAPVLMVPIVKGHVCKGFTTIAAIAQAALQLGVDSETVE